METEFIELRCASPGQRHRLKLLRFGTSGLRPKVVIQAALHADEVPAMLVAQRLRARLQALESAGELCGEVVLVPYANPLGLSQQVLGQHQGRFDLRDGINFNRHLPDLSRAAGDALQGRLGADADRNAALVRGALRQAADALTALHPVDDLKNRLLQTAIDADIVLDLHCDSDATMHLYGLTPQRERLVELGALLGARAVLLATESGDSPFDEACSRPWLLLQERFAEHPIPLGCFASTVELRGERDTDHALADTDAAAIVEFLRRSRVVAGVPAPLPSPRCEPTPLSGSEPVIAPCAGVAVFHHAPGARVEAGAVIADLVDPDSGELHPVRARSAGLLYARAATRWATPGKRLAKIAGLSLARQGKLLSE